MMSWPFAHLLINHFPLVLLVMGLLAALGGLILNRRQLWLHAMGMLTIAGAIVYPVLITGHRAAHALHNPWYVARGVIMEHHEAGMTATFVILLVGVVSGYGWWRTLHRPAESIPVWLRSVIVLGALAGFSTAAYTSYLGGKIIHEAPVLNLPQAPAGVPPAVVAPQSNSHDDDEMH